MPHACIDITTFKNLANLNQSTSIAIVGNAKSLFGKHQGSEIDSHDCVIRLNYGAVREPDHQGRKTDIVGCSDDKITLSYIHSCFSPKSVIWLTNKLTPAHFFDDNSLPVYINSALHWQKTAQLVLPHRPSSGAIAAYFIREILHVRDVHLYGFDFFTTPTFYHTKNKKLHFWRKKRTSPHSGESELRLMRTLNVCIH